MEEDGNRRRRKTALRFLNSFNNEKNHRQFQKWKQNYAESSDRYKNYSFHLKKAPGD